METNTNYKYKSNLEGEEDIRNEYFWKGVSVTGIVALYNLGQCTPDGVYGKGNNQNIEKDLYEQGSHNVSEEKESLLEEE